MADREVAGGVHPDVDKEGGGTVVGHYPYTGALEYVLRAEGSDRHVDFAWARTWPRSYLRAALPPAGKGVGNRVVASPVGAGVGRVLGTGKAPELVIAAVVRAGA